MDQLILVNILLIVLSTTLESSQSLPSCKNRDTNDTKCACEAHENFSISCTNNQTILILGAFYGRDENETCNDGKGTTYQNWSLSCRFLNPTEVLSKNCSNQSTCSIGKQEYKRFFGDPCVDTGKYLLVNYTCLSAYQPSTFSVDQSTAKPTGGTCQCQPEDIRNVSWPPTICGSSQTQNCPNNPKRKNATRWCLKDREWSHPNLVYCITEEIERMGQELKSLEANFTVSAANELMSGVKNISLSNDLYGGDLYELTKIMLGLINISLNYRKRFDASDADYISALTLNSTSNLLSAAYDETWKELLPYHQSQTATRLLDAMEKSSAIWTRATKSHTSCRKSVPGIELEIDVINVTEAKLQKSYITFNAFDLHFDISLENVESRASNDKLGRVAFILYDDIEKRLTSNANINETREAAANATEADNGTHFKPFIITKVVSASIISDREPPTKKLINSIRFTLEHKSPKRNESKLKCVFWKFSKHDFVGHWSDEGCEVESSNEYNTTCNCSHLTSFAVLMSAANRPTSEIHQFVLHVITYIGCAISIVCLAIALFTFSFFRNLQSDRNTIHKNLVLSLLVAELIFVFGSNQYDKEALCAVVAGFLHYFFLASFAWMCLEGVQLYILLVEVFEIEKSRVKWYYLGGYGIPALIVLISACVNIKIMAEYPHGGYGTKEYCWLNKDRNYFVWAFNGPVLAVLAVNLVMLGLAIYMMCKHASAASWKLKEKSNIYKIGSWLRGAAILVVLLGTTWTFGIFLTFENKEVAFDYIFAILNSLQGLFIFVFHCLANDKVRKEYQRAMERSTWIPECVRVRCVAYDGNGALATPNQSTSSGKTLLQRVFPKNKRKQSVSSCSSQQKLDSPSSDSKRGFRVIFSSPQEKEWPRLINTVSESVQLTDSSGFASNESDAGKSTDLSGDYSESFNARINDSQFSV